MKQEAWAYYNWGTTMKGVGAVMARVNRELEEIPGKTLAGLIKVAALVHNETEQGSVRVPVKWGNLRHSWFVTASSGSIISGGGKKRTAIGGGGKFTGPKASEHAARHSYMVAEARMKCWYLSARYKGPFLIMGYSANYAMYVHEMVGTVSGKDIHWNRPGSGPKWFEYAIRKHLQAGNIKRIVIANAKT
jgi:hypothetical protein